MSISEYRRSESLNLRTVRNFRDTAGADEQSTVINRSFIEDTQLVIAFKVVNHLNDGSKTLRRVIEHSTVAVTYDVKPLRCRELLTGKAVKRGVSIVNKQTESTHSNRLVHTFGNSAEHRIAPEIGAVKSLDGL